MIEHYSHKIQNAIQKELFKANKSIKIAVAWFTNDLLFQPLLLKLAAGVTVEIILNKDEINCSDENEIDFDEFVNAGGILRWNDTKQLLHDKFCIIDSRVVITGSYNWTNKAEYNQENITIFQDEDSTTAFFDEKYKELSLLCKDKESLIIPKAGKVIYTDCDAGFVIDEFGVKFKYENFRIKDYISKKDVYIDEFGAFYINDQKKLIKVPNLRSYKIHNETEVIAPRAFQGCSNLQFIKFGSSKIQEIPSRAFSGCSSLKEIVIPEGVKSIGEESFYSCISLQHIIIPNSVTSIGNYAFRGCSSLQHVVIPDSVNTIGAGLFSECSSLQHVVIPDSVTTIETCAFWECKSLCNVDIPQSVTSIEDTAFWGCSSLQHIVIPNSVTSIGDLAFDECSSLKQIIIPDSVTFIGEGAFGGQSLDSIKVSVRNKMYDSRDDCNAIIETQNNILISGCKSTVIPETVTGIGYYAFAGCSSLEQINIPNGVTFIGDLAFCDCSSLKQIVIPEQVSSIGTGAFQGCQSLDTIRVSSNNKKYDSREDCNAIIDTEKNLLIAGCKSTIIPDSVTAIGESAFSGYTSMYYKEIPNSVSVIGEYSFYNCSSLQEIIIPDSVKTIGNYAFTGCSSIQKLNIPSSIKFIGKNLFGNCPSLNSIVVSGANTVYDSRDNCNAIIETQKDLLVQGCRNTIIPDSVKAIGNGAFMGCSSLLQIDIPQSVSFIDDFAFSKCSCLQQITIPASVINIGINIFHECSALNKIFIHTGLDEKIIKKLKQWVKQNVRFEYYDN